MSANFQQCSSNPNDLCWDNPNRDNVAIQYDVRGTWRVIYQGNGSSTNISNLFNNGDEITFGLSPDHGGGTIPPPKPSYQNKLTLSGMNS